MGKTLKNNITLKIFCHQCNCNRTAKSGIILNQETLKLVLTLECGHEIHLPISQFNRLNIKAWSVS